MDIQEIIDLLEKQQKAAIEKVGERYVYFSFKEAEGILNFLKQQPTAGDFTKELRRRVTEYRKLVSPFAQDTISILSRAEEACGRLDRAEAINKDLLEACERMLGAMACDELNNGRVFDDDLRKEVKEQAKQAIAKAKKEG